MLLGSEYDIRLAGHDIIRRTLFCRSRSKFYWNARSYIIALSMKQFQQLVSKLSGYNVRHDAARAYLRHE